MALPRLTSSDVGAPARDKINAAIEAAEAAQTAVPALEQAIADEATARISAARSEAQARADAVAWEARERADAIAVETQARLDALAVEEKARRIGDEDSLLAALTAIFSGSQPGVAPKAFANAALGAMVDLAPLDPGGSFSGPLGPAWRIDGSGCLAPRAAVSVDPDAIWIVQARYWRSADVLDPNNDAVDLGLQWLDPRGADAGTTLLHRETDLRVQNGPQTRSFRVPSVHGAQLAIAAPPGAVSWRPYLRTYGADGATAVALLGTRDVTFAGVYVPDVADIAARIGTIEGQLAAGLPLTAPILPSYAVADLPKPGTRGRKAFALDGRASNTAGGLEAPNAGTGVEVTDNGAAWVITGTNQQVQA